MSLASIKQTANASPPRILVHGPPKVGKSTFFSLAPNPIFIQTEDGLDGINTNAFDLAKTYGDFISAINVLISEEHEFKTLVIDSADWLERLIHNQICKEAGCDTIEQVAGGYGRGHSIANNYWRELLLLLENLRSKKQMIIGFICHSRLKTINDPELEPYDFWQMKLHSPKSGQGACEILSEWCDVIGFAKVPIYQRTKETKSGQNKIFAATTSNERVLCLQNNAAYLAGTRYDLPPELPLNWGAFSETFNKNNRKGQ